MTPPKLYYHSFVDINLIEIIIFFILIIFFLSNSVLLFVLYLYIIWSKLAGKWPLLSHYLYLLPTLILLTSCYYWIYQYLIWMSAQCLAGLIVSPDKYTSKCNVQTPDYFINWTWPNILQIILQHLWFAELLVTCLANGLRSLCIQTTDMERESSRSDMLGEVQLTSPERRATKKPFPYFPQS